MGTPGAYERDLALRNDATQPCRGKASVLGQLCEDFRIPPFFCLSTEGIEHWQVSKEDPSVLDALRVALSRLDPADGASFAVRSSAVGEDGAATSFAGQYTTVLGVRSLPELIAAIDLCLHSASSPRVSAYQGGGVQGSVPPMGVIVQRLIRACVSAAAFSLDPATGSPEEILVNAV
jgi:rifampicin phosphotransferase